VIRRWYSIKYRFAFLGRVETPMAVKMQSVARMRAQINQFAGRKQASHDLRRIPRKLFRRGETFRGVGASSWCPLQGSS